MIPLHGGIGNNAVVSALSRSGNSYGKGAANVCVILGGEFVVTNGLLEATGTAIDSARAATMSSRVAIAI